MGGGGGALRAPPTLSFYSLPHRLVSISGKLPSWLDLNKCHSTSAPQPASVRPECKSLLVYHIVWACCWTRQNAWRLWLCL